MDFSKDSTKLLTGCNDKNIRCWDVETPDKEVVKLSGMSITHSSDVQSSEVAHLNILGRTLEAVPMITIYLSRWIFSCVPQRGVCTKKSACQDASFWHAGCVHARRQRLRSDH